MGGGGAREEAGPGRAGAGLAVMGVAVVGHVA